MPRGRVATMKATTEWMLALSLMAAAGAVGTACGPGADGGGGDEGSQLIRARFETEMKVILRDLAAAEETARVQEGRYLGLAELRSAYFTRPLPSPYRLQVSELTAEGYRAEIVHGPTGLRCELVVGAGPAGGRGSARCR